MRSVESFLCVSNTSGAPGPPLTAVQLHLILARERLVFCLANPLEDHPVERAASENDDRPTECKCEGGPSCFGACDMLTLSMLSVLSGEVRDVSYQVLEAAFP